MESNFRDFRRRYKRKIGFLEAAQDLIDIVIWGFASVGCFTVIIVLLAVTSIGVWGILIHYPDAVEWIDESRKIAPGT